MFYLMINFMKKTQFNFKFRKANNKNLTTSDIYRRQQEVMLIVLSSLLKYIVKTKF